MKQTTAFTMKDGSKHVIVLENPTEPDLFKEMVFEKYEYVRLDTQIGRTVVLNPKYIVSVEITEK